MPQTNVKYKTVELSQFENLFKTLLSVYYWFNMFNILVNVS